MFTKFKKTKKYEVVNGVDIRGLNKAAVLAALFNYAKVSEGSKKKLIQNNCPDPMFKQFYKDAIHEMIPPDLSIEVAGRFLEKNSKIKSIDHIYIDIDFSQDTISLGAYDKFHKISGEKIISALREQNINYAA
jgi:hypothetical protein